jgi:hypothetical protein
MSKSPKSKKPQNLEGLKARLSELQSEMQGLGVVMRGSVVVIGVRNKQPYFSLNKGGKTHLIYLGKKREGLARQYSQNYRRLRDLVEEMTAINMTLLKADL